MAFFSDTPAAADRPAFFAALSARVAAALHRFAEAQDRSAAVDALNRLSDRELADIGIPRHDIVRHVYRDYYSV